MMHYRRSVFSFLNFAIQIVVIGLKGIPRESPLVTEEDPMLREK